jgi:uncharacterized protein (TIGR03086 family)
MNAAEAAAVRNDGAGLLERAVGFALGAVRAVTPGALADPTPCRGWDLGMLLCHLNDSLAALHEVVDTASVSLVPPPEDDRGVDLVTVFRERAGRLLDVWTTARDHQVVTVGGCPIRGGVVAGTGALEIIVHGWDIARACGEDRVIPAALATRLLRMAPVLISDDTRPGLFDPPVAVSPGAAPGNRLVAFLGRDPAYGSAA